MQKLNYTLRIHFYNDELTTRNQKSQYTPYD